jgi:hypothetical protein
MNITIYTKERPRSLNHFIDAYVHHNLRYYASDLQAVGLTMPADIYIAVGRALKACQSLNIAANEHIKTVYLFRDGTIYSDWLLSPLGLKLVLLNADPTNSVVAKIQMRLLNE